MSATRDPSQKIGFVNSNLYALYRKGKAAAQGSQPGSAKVLKADDLHSPFFATGQVREAASAQPAQVQEYRPAEFLQKRQPAAIPAAAPAVHTPAAPAAKNLRAKPGILQGLDHLSRTHRPAAPLREQQALSSLKQNLDTLNQLHARLKFMLQELEDLVQD